MRWSILVALAPLMVSGCTRSRPDGTPVHDGLVMAMIEEHNATLDAIATELERSEHVDPIEVARHEIFSVRLPPRPAIDISAPDLPSLRERVGATTSAKVREHLAYLRGDHIAANPSPDRWYVVYLSHQERFELGEDCTASLDLKQETPAVALFLGSAEAQKVNAWTQRFPEHRIALVDEDEVLVAARIEGEIDGRELSITMGSSDDRGEAEALFRRLTTQP